jgi:hypothetical protein
MRDAELKALDQVRAVLAEGDLDRAGTILEPHASSAQIAETLVLLGRVRSLQGDSEKAIAYLRRADELEPGNVKAPHFLAELLEMAGKHQEALQYRRRVAYSTASATADALVRLIVCIIRGTRERTPTGELRVALRHLREAADLTPELAAQAAAYLYCVTPLRDEARALYAQGAPAQVGEIEFESTWTTLVRWCETAGIPLHHVAGAGRPGRRPVAAWLTTAEFMPGLPDVPFVDGGRFAVGAPPLPSLRTRRAEPSSPVGLVSTDRVLVRARGASFAVDRPCVYVGGCTDAYENALQHVGGLATLDALGLLRADLPLLVHASARHGVDQWLALVGLDSHERVDIPQGAICRAQHVLFPARSTTVTGWVEPLLIGWYRRRAALTPEMSPASGSLYIGRPASDKGHISNYLEFAHELRHRGFDCVEPDDLPLHALVKRIASAERIIAFDSPSLVCLMFARSSARITMIQEPGRETELRVRVAGLIKASGLSASVHALRRARARSKDRAFESELEVDIKRLLSEVINA